MAWSSEESWLKAVRCIVFCRSRWPLRPAISLLAGVVSLSASTPIRVIDAKASRQAVLLRGDGDPLARMVSDQFAYLRLRDQEETKQEFVAGVSSRKPADQRCEESGLRVRQVGPEGAVGTGPVVQRK